MTDRTALRENLITMRERLLDNLGERVDAGDLALLAGVDAAIRAIDAERLGAPPAHESAAGCDDAGKVVSPPSAPPLRAVIRDEPRRAVEVQLYDQRGLVAALPVSAHRALALASDLIAAARSRLVE